ncbi:MAG TPA: hypothetical protein PLH94_05920 [Fimbriimonadaceae bacterium]|nr:hypothetical protein [Fimbriimonadaceae bacterium]
MNKKTPWLFGLLGLALLVAAAYHHHHRTPLAHAEAPAYTGAGLEARANTPPGMSTSLDAPAGAAGGLE